MVLNFDTTYVRKQVVVVSNYNASIEVLEEAWGIVMAPVVEQWSRHSCEACSSEKWKLDWPC